MGKKVLTFATFVFLLGAFNFVAAQTGKQSTQTPVKKDLKFLEDITIEPDAAPAAAVISETKTVLKTEVQYAAKKEITLVETPTANALEKASGLQFKYALLLDLEVEMIKNLNLFRLIDEWWGTRYRYGGMSKMGIDCSALMQVFFTALYGISLPRTARDQYNFTERVSRTELREGDLVFFNTRGGVSHVGMYIANNKFLHASTSGVTISSLFDNYYAKRFIGVGRIDGLQSTPSMVLTSKP